MDDWLRVCAAERLALNTACVVVLDGVDVAVFRCGENSFYAVEDRCPHRGARLSRGLIYEDAKVACLDHGWGVCLRTGLVELPQNGQVRTFELKVENGAVWVKR